ncbi:MAG TPA: TldD/PmbA family protein [Dehalococcoidia bacterium]|nr:TldD/PmbA family protein [Dehalococcoidia bacterium]
MQSYLTNIIELALRRGAQEAEAFYSEVEETPVLFEANRLKQLNARQVSGVALRVIAGGRLGAASSSRPGDLEGLAEMALEAAPYGPEAHFSFPATDNYPPVEVYDPQVEAFPLDDMVHLGQSLIDAVRREEPELVCDASVRKAVHRVMGLNSNGGRFEYRRTVFSLGVHGTLVRGTDMLFVGDSQASCQAVRDGSSVIQEVFRQLRWAERTATVRTGEMPVVFTPQGVAGALVGPLVTAFSGRMVLQGQSPLAGRLGEGLYDRRFSLWDDPTRPYRTGSRICDDEGVASRRLPLVEEGVVRNFLYDLQTAGLAGAQPTGHGSRGPGGQVGISPSCLVFAEGEKGLEELVREVGEGLVVEQLMGAGQGNVLGGDFSGNVLLGYKIEGGEVVGRVKDTVVAGNVHRLLGEALLALGRGRWVGGSLYVPPIAFARLSVAAKG